MIYTTPLQSLIDLSNNPTQETQHTMFSTEDFEPRAATRSAQPDAAPELRTLLHSLVDRSLSGFVPQSKATIIAKKVGAALGLNLKGTVARTASTPREPIAAEDLPSITDIKKMSMDELKELAIASGLKGGRGAWKKDHQTEDGLRASLIKFLELTVAPEPAEEEEEEAPASPKSTPRTRRLMAQDSSHRATRLRKASR